MVLGDSISAAYGMAQRRGWVALLEERLKGERLDYSVVNASVTGDTTAGGLARLGPALERYRPALVPSLLEGFCERLELFQPDRIHPTEAAQPLMADRVWQALRPMLRST